MMLYKNHPINHRKRLLTLKYLIITLFIEHLEYNINATIILLESY